MIERHNGFDIPQGSRTTFTIPVNVKVYEH